MTTQETLIEKMLHNLEMSYERIAAYVKADSAKLDSLAETLTHILETQYQIIQTQTRLMLILTRMNERMDSAEARRVMREAEARKEARRAKTAKLQFRAIYALTAICVALLIVIITKSVFFPA